MGRFFVQGVDVWLNNPRRPLEASGTSGQKVVLNGGLNLSVLDGWWAEAYDGMNGFAIGTGRTHSNMNMHDTRDGEDLYRVLQRRSDSALLPARPRWPAARLDQAHEAHHPHTRLALQRRPHGDGLHVEVLRAGGGRNIERHERKMVIASEREVELIRYLNLKLAALGQPVSEATVDRDFLEIAGPLLRNHYQKDRLLSGRLCPVDARIQAFLKRYLGDCAPDLPSHTLVLDRPGLGRVTSLPAGEDRIGSPYLQSYRLRQGVLHNPRSDRRTTQGIFHVVEGGLPIPADKIAVPKTRFAKLLAAAVEPPDEVLELPFTSNQEHKSACSHRCCCGLSCVRQRDPSREDDGDAVLRARQSGEQSRFCGAHLRQRRRPHLPENDAALDAMHWTGHTGCVILAPHWSA